MDFWETGNISPAYSNVYTGSGAAPKVEESVVFSPVSECLRALSSCMAAPFNSAKASLVFLRTPGSFEGCVCVWFWFFFFFLITKLCVVCYMCPGLGRCITGRPLCHPCLSGLEHTASLYEPDCPWNEKCKNCHAYFCGYCEMIPVRHLMKCLAHSRPSANVSCRLYSQSHYQALWLEWSFALRGF